MTVIPKVKYLTNKDLLKEIHRSKNTYCSFTKPEYSSYDLILPSLEKINIRSTAAAKKKRAERLAKVNHEAAQKPGQKTSLKEFEINYKKIEKKKWFLGS